MCETHHRPASTGRSHLRRALRSRARPRCRSRAESVESGSPERRRRRAPPPPMSPAWTRIIAPTPSRNPPANPASHPRSRARSAKSRPKSKAGRRRSSISANVEMRGISALRGDEPGGGDRRAIAESCAREPEGGRKSPLSNTHERPDSRRAAGSPDRGRRARAPPRAPARNARAKTGSRTGELKAAAGSTSHRLRARSRRCSRPSPPTSRWQRAPRSTRRKKADGDRDDQGLRKTLPHGADATRFLSHGEDQTASSSSFHCSPASPPSAESSFSLERGHLFSQQPSGRGDRLAGDRVRPAPGLRQVAGTVGGDDDRAGLHVARFSAPVAVSPIPLFHFGRTSAHFAPCSTSLVSLGAPG